ncbi:10488_t:CDS:2, partial [Acaulospora morrowiae]
MERNNSLDPAFVQLAQSNIELREELNRKVEINRTNERKIRKLIRDLEKCEGELTRRSTTILDQEEIQNLKNQITDLRKQLRSALKEIKANETVIDAKNNQIAGSPIIGDDTTLASFESLCQSIRNNLQLFPTTTLGNTVRRALDGITQHYNQSQDEKHILERRLRNLLNATTSTIQNHQNTIHRLNDQLTQEIERANNATNDNGALWRTNANIRDVWRMCEEDYRSEKLKHYKNKAQPRAILYGKYNKWKNRTRDKHAKFSKWKLRTRLNYNNNRNMAGYELPKFRGLTDPEDFIRVFADGDAKDWYESRIKNKNWELQNITANTGVATFHAINALTNNQIRAIDVARFRGRAQTIRETAPADGNLPARPLVPPHSVWDEDWITSGGQPTDLAPNPPNVGNNGNVVAPNITIGQTRGRELPRPRQMEPGKLYSDPKLRFNYQEWLTGYGTLERLNTTAKDTSFFQNITDIISKGVFENISGFFLKKNAESDSAIWQKNIEQDSDEELSNRMIRSPI